MLALFPSFDSPVVCGVEDSGREAWRSITTKSPASAEAFHYKPETGRLTAVLQALDRRVGAGTVLVWHCGLLRLVPLIAARRQRLIVFLHGIEAWKTHDLFTEF